MCKLRSANTETEILLKQQLGWGVYGQHKPCSGSPLFEVSAFALGAPFTASAGAKGNLIKCGPGIATMSFAAAVAVAAAHSCVEWGLPLRECQMSSKV